MLRFLGWTNILGMFSAISIPNWPWLNMVLIFTLALVIAYIINRVLSSMTPLLATALTRHADTATTKERFLRIRRLETYLSLALAIGRVIVIAAALILAWRIASPTTTPMAIIGASTLFAVLAGATLVPLLQGITYGFVMIIEHWYNVGDHIVVEPFPDVGGIVEQVTLRSTKLRSVNGETIWLHNQHMHAVRVTNVASHTLAIETFVQDPKRGEQLINDAFRVIPASPATIPEPPVITEIKSVSEQLWRITAICEVTPYQEWIIQQFAVETIKERNRLAGPDAVIIHGPIVYYADVAAEKRYSRAIQHPGTTPDQKI